MHPRTLSEDARFIQMAYGAATTGLADSRTGVRHMRKSLTALTHEQT